MRFAPTSFSGYRIMPFRAFAACLLACLLPACVHTAPSSHASRSWLQAQQLVLVTADDWNASRGQLRRFERVGQDLKPGDLKPKGLQPKDWKQIGDATPVMLGRNGSAWGIGLHAARHDGPIKQEGDGRAPAGVFAIGTAFGYAEHANTGLPYQAMTANDWCIDVPASNYYNKIIDRSVVKAPYLDQSSEPMRRDLHAAGDQRYREGFVIEHNVEGAARQGGSCIFAHLWKAPGETTAGCTAMAPEAMDHLLAWLDARKQPVFVLLPKAQYLHLQHDWQLPEVQL